MSKVAVVFWSGSGNTEAMANAVVAGAKAKGAEVTLFGAVEFSAENPADYDGIAFGCPAMGAEQLEESEFQPMWDEVKAELAGKKVGLFGSYAWASGEWMDTWKADAEGVGITLSAAPVICNSAPDDNALKECEALGAALA